MMLATLGAQAAAPKSSCAPTATAEADITAVARSVFAAARADDLPGFRALTTADFYAYDNGLLFTGDELMSFIKQAHAAGKKFEWSVTDPKVHVACNLGWITYVNKGSIEDTSGKRDMTWLESEVLEYTDGHWRVHFLHSTRAAPQPAPKPAG
jgi:hypothetical protein